jgi:hypothetical protein
MAVISQNQSDYLNGLVKAGGGNSEWAKAQLQGSSVAPVNKTPTTGYGISSTPQTAKPVPLALNQNDGRGGRTPAELEAMKNAIIGLGTNFGTAAPQTPKPLGTFNPPSYAGDSPAPTPAPVVAPTQVQQSQPSASSGNADLINSMYDQNYASQLQKLRDSRDQQLAGLANQDNVIGQNRISQLNNNDATAAQQMKALQESMANNGQVAITSALKFKIKPHRGKTQTALSKIRGIN